jgi:hypothetical protein
VSKKVKDPLEQVFGKGKRLPVFTVITYSSKDTQKKQKSKKQSRSKKTHNFSKQMSEKITNTQNLDSLLFPATTVTSKKSKKRIVFAEDKTVAKTVAKE